MLLGVVVLYDTIIFLGCVGLYGIMMFVGVCEVVWYHDVWGKVSGCMAPCSLLGCVRLHGAMMFGGSVWGYMVPCSLLGCVVNHAIWRMIVFSINTMHYTH